MKDIYNETDKKIRGAMKSKEEKELGHHEEWPIRTNLELQRAIETRENDVLYIEKSLFKRLGDTDLKKLGRKHLSFVIVECEKESSFKDRLRVDVGRVNRISGREEFIEQVAVNVYSAILEIKPRTEEEEKIRQKLLRGVNKYIHTLGDASEQRNEASETSKASESKELKEIER